MGIVNIFKNLKHKYTLKTWRELGQYNATFTAFGKDAYQDAVVRSCIRPLADFSSKAKAVCSDKRIERILNDRPNMYMNGADFLNKVRTRLELYNNVFIYLERDNNARVIGFYPVPYSWFQAVEYQNGLYIEFHFSGAAETLLTLPWADLVAVRKDYNSSDIAGDSNAAIFDLLELLNTTNEGLANSIKSTANLRGLLKSTKAMLAPDAVKASRDQFVADYMTLGNEGGIAALDSTMDFVPIKMEPSTATYDQMREIRENVYRYFGINDDIIMGKVKTEGLENFYRLRIEPFLVALSRELTSKVYPGKAGAYDNSITYIAEQGQFMTVSQKIDLFNKVVLYGGLLTDEWREYMGLGHIEGGDKPIMRLDAAPADAPRGEDAEE